ncbi:hypothetical protein KDH83_27140 [Achromobacter sp. Marseille-Q0513]|uniref:hypothetical protein n=1 Tax=Achromobacter sp. Marseille-Q0513 TaxID=2829161 RepID=UPI001B906632|nr:hypothetical protein [Achromobacter sp. Marseille-Q0513]MBR8656998.1 hypothetical protein [Achromobacter sp. Marseille-Q0513]
MEAIAKKATFEALQGYPKPRGNLENLTLGSEVTETAGIFELYISGERPQDARVISRAIVDREHGGVRVEVFPDEFSLSVLNR